MEERAHRTGAARRKRIRRAVRGRQHGDDAQLRSPAPRRRRRAANARRRCGAKLERAAVGMQRRGGRRPSSDERAFARLWRTGVESRLAAGAGSRQRDAQGPEELQNHRPADARRRQRQDRDRPASVRHRCRRARHALRRLPEVSRLRRHGEERQCRRHQGAARRARRLHRSSARGQPRRRSGGGQRRGRDRRCELVGGEPSAQEAGNRLGRGPDRSSEQRAVCRDCGRSRRQGAGGLSASRRRRRIRASGGCAGRGGGLLLSVPRPHQSRAAKLHRPFRRRQGRPLGADAEPRRGREAGGGDAWNPRAGRHGQHDAGGRRLRTAPAQRFHGRGRLDLEARGQRRSSSSGAARTISSTISIDPRASTFSREASTARARSSPSAIIS